MNAPLWVEMSLTDMQDAADAEGYAALTDLDVPSRELLGTLPYFGAFSDYQEHVASCATCALELVGCPEGEEMAEVSQIGVTEQHRIAESN